jgi:hypothetical protein
MAVDDACHGVDGAGVPNTRSNRRGTLVSLAILLWAGGVSLFFFIRFSFVFFESYREAIAAMLQGIFGA